MMLLNQWTFAYCLLWSLYILRIHAVQNQKALTIQAETSDVGTERCINTNLSLPTQIVFIRFEHPSQICSVKSTMYSLRLLDINECLNMSEYFITSLV